MPATNITNGARAGCSADGGATPLLPGTGGGADSRQPTAGNVLAVLNDRGRVTYDPAQWILERRQKRATKKSSGYQQQNFCTQRRTLIRCIEGHPRIERLRRERRRAK